MQLVAKKSARGDPGIDRPKNAVYRLANGRQGNIVQLKYKGLRESKCDICLVSAGPNPGGTRGAERMTQIMVKHIGLSQQRVAEDVYSDPCGRSL